MELPAGLGRVDGTIASDIIHAKASLPDGEAGTLIMRKVEKPLAPHEMSVRLESLSDGTPIAATVVSPAEAGEFPAVVVVHGGGDSSRESAPGYAFWASWLARHGIVGLIYDKRGNGESGGDWRAVGFTERAGDVRAGLALLRSLPQVDDSRVGLIAVSQGSWVGDVVAAMDTMLAFVVHVSGPATTVADADTHATLRRLLRQGAPPSAVVGILELWSREVEAVLHPGRPELRGLAQRGIEEAASESWFDDFPYGLEPTDSWWWNWYGLVGDFDPMPYLQASRARMLWLYGDVDTQSELDANLDRLERLRFAGKPHEVAVYSRAGHGLMIPAGRHGESLGTLTVAPGVFDRVFEFIHR